MIRIDSATRKLQAKLGGAVSANQLPIVVSYADLMMAPANGPTPFDDATVATQTDDTTAVDICSPPSNNAQNIVREIDAIKVHNADTASATVTIQIDDNGTLTTILAVALSVGDTLTYSHLSGWECIDSTGAVKR